MKIHSSSLRHTQANLNRQPVGKQNSARNKDEKEVQSVDKVRELGNSHYPSNPSEEIRPVLKISGPSNALTDKDNFIRPRDTRVLRALSAYTHELNQPLADHINNLAQRIDTFV